MAGKPPKHSKYSEPTIEWLIDQIAPNKGNSPLLNFNKKRLLLYINKEKAKAELVKYSQYEPIIVSDEVGNKYLCLNLYEVHAIRHLLLTLQGNQAGDYDTGDWYHDLPPKIKKFQDRLAQLASEGKAPADKKGKTE